MPEMDYSKLMGKMREQHLTQDALAAALGMSRQQMNNKLNGRSPFKQSDIKKTCSLLGIPLEDVGAYFFTDAVTKT